MNMDRVRNLTGIAASLMLVFTLVACGGGGGGGYGGGGGTPPSSTVVVTTCTGTPAATIDAVSTTSFNPATVSITANQVVKWNNATGTTHSVTSTVVPANGTFSADFNNGTSVCLQFTATGAFNYHCRFHTNMTGVVNVN